MREEGAEDVTAEATRDCQVIRTLVMSLHAFVDKLLFGEGRCLGWTVDLSVANYFVCLFL